MKEIGYVITLISLGGYQYFRGCMHDTKPVWTSSLRGAHIYRGMDSARSTIKTSNKIPYNVKPLCQIKKVGVCLEEE